MHVEFQTLSIQSGDTQTTTGFSAPVVAADVALKRFSGSNVSCEVAGFSRGQVAVTASSDQGGTIEVLVIGVVSNV